MICTERLVGLIDAHTFDLYDEPMLSLADLQSYAVRTAGTVFELAARILAGDVGSAAVAVAIEAGQAQTIANTLALLPRHAARHQLYAPLELLRHYGAEPKESSHARDTRIAGRARRACACVPGAILRKSALPVLKFQNCPAGLFIVGAAPAMAPRYGDARL